MCIFRCAFGSFAFLCFGVLACWRFGVLLFLCFGVLAYWLIGVLAFSRFGFLALGFWRWSFGVELLALGLFGVGSVVRLTSGIWR